MNCYDCAGIRFVCIQEDGKMVGHWVQEKSGKYLDGKHRLAARGLAAKRQRSGRDTAG